MKKFESLKQRIQKNFKDNKVLFFVCVAIWTITVIATLLFYKTSLGMDSIGSSDYSNNVEINKNNTIVQVLPVEKETKSIGLNFGTYRRKNNGSINIELMGNDSSTVYLNKKVNVSFIEDSIFSMYELNEELSIKNDKSVTLKLTSNSEEGKAIGIYYGNGKYNDKDLLKINDKEVDGTIAYRFMIENKILHQFNQITVIASISILSLLIIWLLLYKPELHYFFAIFVLMVGLIFMAIITPSSPPDETIHLEFAVQESNLLLFNDDVYDVDSQYIDVIADNYYAGSINDKKAYIDIIENINNKYNKGNKVKTYDVDINDIYKIQLLPQSIGIVLGRILKLNPLKVFYLGRLTNLLFYVICVFICVKKTPVYKTLFGILASLPILIQQAASFSYDVFVNGMCLLTIAYLIKMKYSEGKINRTDYITAFIICILLAPAKYIYGFLALLFWLIPSEKYGSKSKKIILSLLLCAPMVYQLYPIISERIIYIIKKTFTIHADSGITIEDENPLYSMGYVVKHFGQTISIILTTIRYNLKIWFYESIGRYLSKLTLILPAKLTYAIILTIVGAIFIKDDVLINIHTRLSLIAACIAVAMFSIGGMLFSETHIHDQYIGGIQGRYFSPLLPYFFVSLTNSKFNIPKKYNNYVIFAYILVIFEVIIYILSYTFVN